jgi:hypothetical protein
MAIKSRSYYRTSPIISLAIMMVVLTGTGIVFFVDIATTKKVVFMAIASAIGIALAFANRIAKEVYFDRAEKMLLSDQKRMRNIKVLAKEVKSAPKYSVSIPGEAELRSFLRETRAEEKNREA